MKLKKLTWSDFDQFQPCYSPQEKYGEFSGTILDILNDERIPDYDKLWAATRDGILDDRTLRLFACACVREEFHLLTDERSRNAVEISEKYANGECSLEDLEAAWAAAWDAARAAAKGAAMAAVSDAAWDAAREAAWAAAWDAARAAAWNAARVKQIEILKNLIKTNYEI